MINALSVVTMESFLLLRRDRIFLPAVVSGLAIAIFANLASDWSVEDFTKILFDVGAFGFQFTGSIVAIFWGVKAVTDSRQDGALEVQLSAPVSRSVWLTGRYLGLVLALTTLAVILAVIWQGLMLLNAFGWMTPKHIAVFGYMYLGWLVLGALAMLFASFCRQTVAMFATLSLWLAGLVTSPIALTLTDETPAATKSIVQGLARVWDLGQFNLAAEASGSNWFTAEELGFKAAYGVLLVLILITAACMSFSRRDLVG